MVQQQSSQRNALNELGYKIFLDRYAQKDMTRSTLQVGDLVIVVVDSKSGQREIGTVTALNLPQVTIQLRDGETVTRDIEHVDKPIETRPEEMMDRVARGVAANEKGTSLQEEWTRNFRWLLDGWRFVPGGRILTAAGTDQELTYYNCMPPEQEILTADGYRPIGDVHVGDYVVTHRNRLRRVLHKFERETEEPLYIIKPRKVRYDDVRLTGDHKVLVIRSEWVNTHRSRDGINLQQAPAWIPAKELRAGDYVALAFNGTENSLNTLRISDYIGVEGLAEEARYTEGAIVTQHSAYETVGDRLAKVKQYRDGTAVVGKKPSIKNELILDEALAYVFGRWVGDGCIVHRTGTDIPAGIKIVFGLDELAAAEEIAQIIEDKFDIPAAIKLSSTGRWYDLWVNSMPLGEFFKSFLGVYSYEKLLPNELMTLPKALTVALLRGVFSADGYISGNYLGIVLSNRALAAQIHQLLLRLGYLFSIRENTHRLGKHPAYRLSGTVSGCSPLFEAFFDTPAPTDSTRDQRYYIEYDDLKWVRIEQIETELYKGTVLDIEVEEDHSLVTAGVVVSNCYVIPSPNDSREGIIRTLGQMTEIMSRGGGVGINISSLRPRHAYVKGVNGRSSGSVSWGALYSFVTGLIEQGGCFGGDERILTDKGLIPAAELADRIDAGETFYAQTHAGLREITTRFRNGIKPLFEVTTKRGYKVRITADHKVAVLMDGKITTMPLKYLQAGDEILLLMGTPQAGDGAQSDIFGASAEQQLEFAAQVLVGTAPIADATLNDVRAILAANGILWTSRESAYEAVQARQQQFAFAGALAEPIAYSPQVSPDTITAIEPLGDAEVYDFEVDDVHLLSANGIYTSNSRRGALMLILNDWHPDVFDFINSKRQMGNITNANISVGVSDKLMEAVKADGDWELVFPDTSDPEYDEFWNGDLETWIASGRKILHYKTVKAREVWHAIIESAWASAEPGVWFRERSNKMANSWYFNPLIATNPCVTGDTRIYTDKGMVKAIDLFNDETQIEAVIDGRFGLERATTPATRVFRTGHKPVYRLQTREGYFLRATADHRIMTPRGWVELQDLQPGDDIHILNRKGGFGAQGSLELGRVLGWLVGDGTLKADRAVLSFFGDEKRELAHTFAQYVTDIVEPMTTRTRAYTVGVVEVADRDEARVQSERLRRIAEEHGLVENKFQVPEVVYQGTEDMQRGFLQALFTADGSVQRASGMTTVRLASSHLALLQNVQQVLSNFGIFSKIYQNRREAQFRDMPDGKGGTKSYWTQAQHELVISRSSILTFATEIGFVLERKQTQLLEYIAAYKNRPRPDSFAARVESITLEGTEDVYDLTEPLTSSFIANSLVIHNCGEQPLGGFSVCNLGALNLAQFYDEEKHDVHWEDLRRAVKYAIRFLDNIIDTTPYFFNENRDVQLGERRVGLGTMGIAELMIRLGIRYGSDESVEFIEKVYHDIARAAYLTSAEIAQEKGTFPMFDAEKFLESGFMQMMDEDVVELIRERGIRNVTLLTQAPTGCVAPDTLVSTSNGLRPIVTLGNPDGEQWQALNTQVYTDEGLRATSHFYINGVAPVKTVTTKHGFTVTATHNHRIRVIDAAGNYVWRRMDEIQPNDKTVLKRNTIGTGSTVMLSPVAPLDSASPQTLTPALAELLGLYMGDSAANLRGGLNIPVNAQDADLLAHVQDLMKQVWGARNSTVEAHANGWTVRLADAQIARFFEVNGLAKSNDNSAFIPMQVLQAGRDVVTAFLRGVFESGGSAHRATITAVAASESFARQMQIALLGVGVVTALRAMPSTARYELRVLNRDEAVCFVEQVGFASQRKQAQSAVWERSAQPRAVGAQGALTQQFVKQMVAAQPTLTAARLALVEALDVYIDAVDSITDGVSATYDLSVPDNKTYIANGFVSHNTTGTMVNTSTGIEPFFSWVYYRKSRLGLHEEQVPLVKEFYENNPQAGALPEYFVTAMDLAPEEHVKVQGAFQKWIDSAISKTCNVPNHYTVEQVAALYEYMYDLGCKGGTIYRDGSRDEQVLMLKKDDEPKEEKPNKEKSVAAQVATPHHVYPRPNLLTGATVKAQTPFGRAYITMNADENGNPFEVFITAPGKAGSDLQADAEGLGRMISLSLRTTAPQNRREMLKLVIEQLRDIGGTRSVGFGPQRVSSLPDAVARALEEHFFPKNSAQQLELPMVTPTSVPAPTNGTKESESLLSGADMCPSCGTISLIRAEGCRKCLTCDYTEC